MIITNSQGVSDYVQDGVNSLLVPVGDATALATRIRELWNDPARSECMAAAAQAFATANCTEDQVVNHLRQVLLDFDLPV
jgi:glycosyltransferase involved in cell wall biosynthesis